PELGPPRREDRMRQRTQQAAHHDRGGGLPHVEAEERDGEDAHEDGRELEIGREPSPEEVDGLPVALSERYVLDAPGFDSGYSLAVVALPYRYDLLDVVSRRRHSSTPKEELARGTRRSLFPFAANFAGKMLDLLLSNARLMGTDELTDIGVREGAIAPPEGEATEMIDLEGGLV